MKIVCTARGTHKARALISLYLDEDDQITPAIRGRLLDYGDEQFGNDTWRWVEPPSFLLDDQSLPGWNEHAWLFKCPSCPRRGQLVNEDRFDQRFREALRVGDKKMDVSLLE